MYSVYVKENAFIRELLRGLGYFFGLMVLPFWIGVPMILMSLNSVWNLPVFGNPLIKMIGIICVILGFCLSLYSTYIFAKKGKGTPAPIAPTKRLTRTGLYRITRNPMYVGYAFYYLGLFFFNGHILLLLYFFAVVTIINIFLIYYEEPQLEIKFGDKYREYKKKVPRWIRVTVR